MNANEKQQRANKLLEVYGALLTKKQQAIMKDKYVYDLSLQEIAAHFKITRAAALDALNTAMKKLEEYESKLSLIKKKAKILKLIKDTNTKKKINELL